MQKHHMFHSIQPAGRTLLCLLLAASLFAAAFVGVVAPMQASTAFIVNSPIDAADMSPGDGACETATGNGICTLRAAIQETNALPGPDSILLGTGTYTQTIHWDYNDTSAVGDLDITDDLTLTGAGANNTIISAHTLERALEIGPSATVAIAGVTIRDGFQELDGDAGGIMNSGHLTLDRSIIANNRGYSGGGVYNYGTLTVTRSTFTGNIADGFYVGGGAISNHGTLAISDSTFRGNSAQLLGGAIYNWDVASASIRGSTFDSNRANWSGGALYNAGTMAITNSTISNNNAATYAGGILNDGSLQLASVTIDGNRATANAYYGDGGGIHTSTPVTIRNTLIAENYSPSGADCVGEMLSAGYNFIQDTHGCTITGDTTGNQSGVFPKLGALRDNGGPTWTQALQRGSPAIDAGDPAGCSDTTGNLLATDQRGGARAVDGNGDGNVRCDIGAFEYGAIFLTPTPTRTPRPTSMATKTPTPTATASATPSPSATATTTPSPTSSPSPTATTTPTSTQCLAYAVADLGAATSQLFVYAPLTSAIQPLGPPHYSADIEAIATDTSSGLVYAASGHDGANKGHLYRVEPETGALVEVGPTGFDTIDALAFRETDHSLWGWAAGKGLVQLDPTTGAGQLILAGSGGSSALAWTTDGSRLYGTSDATLWTYDQSANSISTIATHFPPTSLFLDSGSAGRILGGVDDDGRLELFVYDLGRQQRIAHMLIPTPFGDLEAIAWPGACADTLLGALPAFLPATAERGAPGSYFAMQAAGFSHSGEVDVTVNGATVGTALPDSAGNMSIALFYEPNAPLGTYIIGLTNRSDLGMAATGGTWTAETRITIDDTAPQLENLTNAPALSGLPKVFLPIAVR
jgi:hypothetical protein